MIYLFMGKKGVGKTTLANLMLKKTTGCHINFADGIRDLLVRGIGFKRSWVTSPDLKDTVLVGGKTVRKIMQDVGEEVKRTKPNFWYDAWATSVEACDGDLFCSDLRFPREYKNAKAGFKDVKLIYVRSRNEVDTDDHVSEHAWEVLIPQADFVIDNDFSMGYLEREARRILRETGRLTYRDMI